VIEGGRVKRVSVAVLVDGNYLKSDKGDVTYQPRGKEEIDRIAALVRSAIGFDEKRGDLVEVVNLRFAEAPVALLSEAPGWFGMLQVTKDDIMYGIELMVMVLLGLIVLLFVVRPMVRRIVTPEEMQQLGAAIASAGGGISDMLTAAGEGSEPRSVPPSQTAQMIDIAQVQGQVHAQSVQKVGELAQRNPQETVSIIRQWLHESAA